MQHRQKPSRVWVSPLALAILAVALVGAGVASVAHALTEAQCEFFEQNGMVQLCHATGSATNPYVLVTASVEACVYGFAEQHPADFIAVDDPLCHGVGCLPAAAPCDATLPCCEALQCTAGVCSISPFSEPEPSPQK
jgi:hypothetical protein